MWKGNTGGSNLLYQKFGKDFTEQAIFVLVLEQFSKVSPIQRRWEKIAIRGNRINTGIEV